MDVVPDAACAALPAPLETVQCNTMPCESTAVTLQFTVTMQPEDLQSPAALQGVLDDMVAAFAAAAGIPVSCVRSFVALYRWLVSWSA